MRDSIHPEALSAFDARATALMGAVTPIPKRPQPQPDRFIPAVHHGPAITDADIIGEIEVGGVDWRRREVALQFFDGAGERGIVGEAYQELARLADQVQRQRALRVVGRQFIIRAIFEWIRDRTIRPDNTPAQMTAQVIPKCLAAITRHVILVPVPDLYVQVPISIGKDRIDTVPAVMLTRLDEKARNAPAERRDEWATLAHRLRTKLQGSAAVVVEVDAEKGRAEEIALERAIAVTDALRLFSPANAQPWTVSLWAPWGFEHRRTSWTLSMRADESFEGMRDALVDVVTFSTLDSGDIAAMRAAGLDALGQILAKESPSDWERRVLAASAIFSRGALTSDTAVRLVHQFSALESLLLRSNGEPIQQNVAERAAFYFHSVPQERRELVRLFRDVYDHRSAYVHHGKSVDDESRLERFATIATQLVWKIVLDSPRFRTKEAFLNEIDEIKFS